MTLRGEDVLVLVAEPPAGCHAGLCDVALLFPSRLDRAAVRIAQARTPIPPPAHETHGAVWVSGAADFRGSKVDEFGRDPRLSSKHAINHSRRAS